jgi:general nucleoside transport system permease protein
MSRPTTPAVDPLAEAQVPTRSSSSSLAATFPLAGAVGAQLAAFLLSMLVLIGLLALLGYGAGAVLQALWDGSAGSAFALSQSLSEAVPLALAGVAVWLAYQAGLFNVGADGQLQIGGVLVIVVSTAMPGTAPALLTIALCIAAGCLGGALWASIAGALRAYRGSNELITTIMLNLIAIEIVSQLIAGALRSPTAQFTPQTEEVPLGAQLGEIVTGSGIPWITVIAMATVITIVLLVQRTRLGLRLRATGLNVDASRHAGVRVRELQLATFCASGALAGLAGALVVLGLRYYIAPGWAPAWGYLGIVIAFLSLRTPLLIPVWAVILGMIGSAGPTLKGDVSVPDAITTLMQALPVIVLFLLYAAGRSISARRRAPVGTVA